MQRMSLSKLQFWERDFIEMSENMELTHFDEHGNAVMVDVSEKKITSRTAVAKGEIYVSEDIMQALLKKK